MKNDSDKKLIEQFYKGVNDFWSHFNSPSGGGGAGGFCQASPLNVSSFLLPHPNSPTGRYLTPEKINKTQADNTLKLENLTGHIPDEVIKQIPDCMAQFKINTALRLAHFLAQCSHESAGFKATQENLNYSADGLSKVFGKYFKNANAADYARQPEKIASHVYADRMGNGNEASKDGYKYRGRGYIQLTGKNNYSAFDKTVDDDILSNPDLVASKYPLLSAAWFWNSRSLSTLADKGATDADVTAITKKVNGGTLGLEDRIKHFKQFYKLLKPK